MLVCKNHVVKGLQHLPAPHVNKISKSITSKCSFCDQEADYKLFLPTSQNNFVAPQSGRQKVGM